MAAEENSDDFGAKRFSDEGPSESWDLDSVSHYAKTQHDSIAQGERTLAPLYWRLGQALHIARKQVQRGHWSRYLEELGVHKVRASKARAIFRTFSTPDAVAEMGIEEAYDKRLGRKPATQRRTGRHKTGKSREQEETLELETFLLEVCGRAEGLIDVAAFATKDRRAELFPVVRLAIERLSYLGRVLGADDEQRAGTTRDGEANNVNTEVDDDQTEKT